MKSKSFWVVILIFVFFLLSVIFLYKNRGELFVNVANIYYKKNNIEKAIDFYEKAFLLNYNDKIAREIYVNLLINSPLTIENQKKISDFLNMKVGDLAETRAYNFVNNVRNEIYKKYPEHYVKNAFYNQQLVRWGKNPITYKIIVNDSVPEYFVDEIKKAFLTWEKASNYQILFLKTEDNPNIIVKFENNNSKDMVEDKFVVAYTYPTISANLLEKMNINFYIKDNLNNYYSNNQVYNTALHEIFHALGFMGHSSNKKNIMYLSKDAVIIQDDKRAEPTKADIYTLQLLYKTRPDVTNSAEIKYEYLPEFLLGNKDEILNIKINEAKTYIQKAPELPGGYMDLAEGYVYKNEQASAVKVLEKALINSESPEITSMICYNLAVVYYQMQNYDEAKKYLEKSLNIKDSEISHYLLAEIYKSEQNFKSAEKEYQYLIIKNPNNIEYIIALTNLYVINRNYIKAIKTLRNYIKNNPNEKNNPRFKPYGVLNIFI